MVTHDQNLRRVMAVIDMVFDFGRMQYRQWFRAGC